MPESLPALSLKARVVAAARALAGRPDTNANLPRDGVGGQLLGGILRPGGEPAARAVSTFLGAYGQSPWFRAALSRVSYDVAATEWQVYVQRPRGKAVRNRAIQRASLPNRRAQLKALQDMGELEPLATHPALDLLDRANPMQTGLQARRTTQIHLDAVGEAFWLLERNALGMPVCLWPLAPHWVKSTATPASPVYRVEFGGFRTEIPATEIIPFIDTDPANPYGRGSGTGQALSDELDTDEYAARMTRAFFFNRAKPDLVVWPKGEQGLREEEVRRLEEQWNRHNQGFWRAFRPFFLKREVEIKELDTNLRNVQFIELRSFERDCYDDQTEALTRRGWVPGVQLREDDEVLSWHPLWQRFVYQVPRRIVKYPYAGEMHHWKNPRVDVCVTPNHRMLVTYPQADEWRFRRSDQCREMFRLEWRIAGAPPEGGETTVHIPNVTFGIPRTTGRHGHEIDEPVYTFDTRVFARWLGYWVTEGHLMKRTDANGQPNRFGLAYHQTQEAEEAEPVGVVAEMIDAATDLDVGTVRVRRANRLTVAGRACYGIEFSNRSVWQWVRDNCGTTSKEKRLPRCVFDWSVDAKRILLEALIDGDGNRYATGVRFATASKQLADDVQELAVLLGLRSAIAFADGMYCVQLTSRQTAWVKGSQCESIQYDGDIWCVDIDGDAFVTRRNGKIAIHGNTCLQVFGVSPEILGIVKPGAARATITVANQIYAQRVQVPRLEMLRTVMQERLMPLFDERLILDYVSPDVQDEELRLQAATAAPWALSVDEWRGLSKHPPLEDDAGKVHMMPGTVTPTLPEEFGDVEPPAPVVAIPPVPPMPGTRPGPGEEPEAPEPPPPMPDDEDELDEDAAAFVAWRRAAKVTLRERG